MTTTTAAPTLRTFLSSPSPPPSRSHSQPPAPPPTDADANANEPTATTPLEGLPPGSSLASSLDAPPQEPTPPAAAASSSARPPLAQLRADLLHNGYCVVPAFLSPTRIARLRAAADTLTAAARSGAWPHVRTLGRQFPPWDAADAKQKGIWGVQHILHPSAPREVRSAFAGLYFDAELLSICQGLMRGGDEDDNDNDTADDEDEPLVMELLNLLVTPPAPFSLIWHRDAIPFSLTPAEEAVRLGVSVDSNTNTTANTTPPHNLSKEAIPARMNHIQYNIPLYPDSSLHLIPSSHRRIRTDTEQRILAADPHAADLPNGITLRAKEGDVVFYDNNIIHTGRYDATAQRATLHGSVGDVRGGTGRAQNILQHGLEWARGCTFAGLGLAAGTVRRAGGMQENLVRLGEQAGREERRGVFDE